ncbi:hypothetical protein ABT084_18380 [Streptomyces sp. NPDC002138]|uniref:hypothetical protein n=1 Tax=Streptomyces sp. NPDC002138 TaxID=3154410 RepID=UPI00332DCA52
MTLLKLVNEKQNPAICPLAGEMLPPGAQSSTRPVPRVPGSPLRQSCNVRGCSLTLQTAISCPSMPTGNVGVAVMSAAESVFPRSATMLWFRELTGIRVVQGLLSLITAAPPLGMVRVPLFLRFRLIRAGMSLVAESPIG